MNSVKSAKDGLQFEMGLLHPNNAEPAVYVVEEQNPAHQNIQDS